MAINSVDPIDLTRRLVNIESTTYREGAAGAFIAEFLAGETLLACRSVTTSAET